MEELDGIQMLRDLIGALSRSAQNYHARQVSDARHLKRFYSIATSHNGVSWRNCKAFACEDARKAVARVEPNLPRLAPTQGQIRGAWHKRRKVLVKTGYGKA